MSMLNLFHLGGHWLALDDKRLVAMDEYPALNLPTVVISDFNHCLTGVMSLEANPSMAAPLIERRLRDEGMVEGETRLEVSDTVRVGKGFQALYSAIPMPDWQRMIRWASASKDHCLIVPLLSVAKRLSRPGQALVLRHGKQVTYLAIRRGSLAHADTLAYSDDVHGVKDSISALADNVRALHGNERRPGKVVWYALDAAPGDDENAFAEQFGAALDMDVQLAPHTVLTLADGQTIRSAMPEVAKAVRAADMASSRLDTFMLGAERILPLAAAAAAVLAVGLLLLGWRAHAQALDNGSRANAMQSQTADMVRATQAQLASMRGSQSDLQQTKQFVERLAAASQSPDMSMALAKVRQSAKTWVRILRLRIDNTDHQIYVEGSIDNGAGGADNLGLFIANLRSAGFDPVAVDPPMGTRSASYFSYALHPAGAAVTRPSP